MKKLAPLLVSCIAVTSVASKAVASADKPLGLSLGGGLVLGGTVDTPDLGYKALDHSGGFMIRGAWDVETAEKMSMGVYASRFDMSFSDADVTATTLELGVALKGLFRTEKFAFRPGLSLGYRTISFGNDAIKHMTGMGLNLSGEIAYQTSGNLSPLAELGFLTQPTGGNSDTAATYGPTFYFLRGVRL